jgi:hypothetical protein
MNIKKNKKTIQKQLILSLPVVIVADDNDDNRHIKREPGVINVLEWWWRKRNGQSIQINKQKRVSHAHLFWTYNFFFFSKAREHV